MKIKLIVSLYIVLFIISGFQIKPIVNEKINCVTYKVSIYPDIELDKIEKNPFTENPNLLEFRLYYNIHNSLFMPVEKLNMDDENNDDIIALKLMTRGVYYKNIDTKEKIVKKSFLDKEFNVIKPYEEFKWTITTETKIINGYKCYKATARFEQFNSMLNVTRTFNPIVWFAPQIPAPYGPKGLDGLPGLVLEGTYNGKMYYYASKIEFDCNEIKSIEKPNEGKFILEEDFKKIIEEDGKKYRQN